MPEKEYASKSHRHTRLEEQIQDLSNRLHKMQTFLAEKMTKPRISIYSADNDVCIGMGGSKWHRIVCQYEGDRCLGGPRNHWHSEWEYGEKGFSLCSFLDQNWKGWQGDYLPGELRYDEIDRTLLALHCNAMREYLQKEFTFWLPCHIYNDFTGEMYRP